jgi:hypothetical protein
LQSSKTDASRAYAIALTSAALVAINCGLAMLIVVAIGVQGATWAMVGGVFLVVGIVTGVGAVATWRRYLRDVQAEA